MAVQTAPESRASLARHGRSFRLAGRLFTEEMLDEAAVLYAFCRAADDAADEAPTRAAAEAALDAIEAELAGDAPPRPLVADFLALAARRGVPLGAARDLLAGVRSDLGEVRIADDEALVRYSYRVAGTVGRMMCGIMGVRAPEAAAYAVALGVGMQITNICRDVAEDARRGRVYVPAHRLRGAGLTPEDVLAGTADRRLLAVVVRDLLELAEGYYAQAERGMPHIPPRPRLAILAASRLYRAIGRRLLRAQGGDPLRGRAATSALDKALALLSAGVGFLRSLLRRPPAPGGAEAELLASCGVDL